MVLLLAACSSLKYNSTTGPKMVVSADHTPFYHNGPLQVKGPDLFFSKGDKVDVLLKEIGYSFVRTHDGQNGYVANEALTSAIPVQSALPSQSTKAPQANPSPAPKPTTTPSAIKTSPATTNAPAIPGFRY